MAEEVRGEDEGVIYTIGTYDLPLQHPTFKLGKSEHYPGSTVFRTYAEAEIEAAKYEAYVVCGVDADWEKDTEPDPPYNSRCLLRDALMIDFSDAPVALIKLMESGDLLRLYMRDLPPREGDFIKSAVAPSVCGFVKALTKAGTKSNPILAFTVTLANGSETSILQNDYVFIAPREYDL
jgi:hypothetical protein